MLPVLKKDLRLFFRDKRNLILVILTPIIIMFILGNIFSGTEKEDYLKNIRLLVCNSDANFLLPDYFDAKTIENCTGNAQRLVSEGKFRGAIIVPENFSKGIRNGFGTSLTVYLDNSEPQTAFALSTAIEAFVNRMNENISTAFITEAWVNLGDLNKKIKFVAKNLESTKSSAELIRKKTANISDAIELINLSKAYYYLGEVNETLRNLRSNLSTGNDLDNSNATNTSNVTNTSSKLNASVNTGQALSQLDSFDDIFANVSSAIGSIENECTFSEQFCVQFNKSIKSIIENNWKIIEKKNQIAENVKTLGNISGILEEKFFAINSELDLMDSSVDTLYAQVDAVAEIKASIHSQLKELENLVVNFTGQIVVLQEDLNKTAILLDEYTSRKPENIVRAVAVKSNDSFVGKSNLFFKSAGILMIVLLFITLLVSSSNIVSEKTSSTFLRNVMSPMPMWNFIMQKLIFLCMLCVVQIILMLAVLSYFKVYIQIDFEIILVLLFTSSCFVSLGLFIGSLSKSENISLLSSLVLAIPMIFLSGVFFPFENMPNFMGAIGKWLPMTLGISEMENVVIYSTGISVKIVVMIFLSALFLFLSSLLLRRKMAD